MMMMTTAAGTANEILTEWEQSLKNYRNHKKSDTAALQLLPTALQWYKLGLSLDALHSQELVSSTQTTTAQKVRTLERNYHELVTALPLDYHESLWKDLNESLWNVLRDESSLESDKTAALSAISQLLNGSARAAQIGMRHWSTENLSTLLDCYTNESTSASLCVLSLLRTYLLDSQVDWEHLLPALHLVQQDSHVWNALVQHMQAHYHPGNHWKELLLKQFADQPHQQQYLTSLLASLHTEEEELQHQLQTAAARMQRIDRPTRLHSDKSKSQQQQNTKEQEIQRRIAHVKAVLPDLGEGFIETALSAHQGRVDETVATLLELKQQWPAILQVTDQQLPRRKQEFQLASSLEQDEEARAIAKATVRAAERQQQQEAHMVDLVLGSDETVDDDEYQEEEFSVKVQRNHNEYNDDYDDQYDDLNQVGNADSGLYDNYDAVRVYNAAFKQVEAEQKFWEESRNTNQSQQNIEAGRKNKGFGPDKMKGGRIPGRGSGGGRGGRGGHVTVSAANINDNEQQNASEKTAGKNTAAEGGKPNLRQKARKMDKRREQQKKAQVKRTGA